MSSSVSAKRPQTAAQLPPKRVEIETEAATDAHQQLKKLENQRNLKVIEAKCGLYNMDELKGKSERCSPVYNKGS